MKKKLLSLLCAAVMVLSTLALASCGTTPDDEGDGAYTRLTVDINPSIEFMVDGENKVVSVTAMNDDGSILIVGEAFVGKTPEEATELAVSLACEMGYLVKGNVSADENTVKISVSGDTSYAEELLAKVEKKASDTLAAFNINGAVQKVEAFSTEALRALADEITVYTDSELAEMTDDELCRAIAACRIETALLLTDEMRESYYAAKESKISFAESEATVAIIEELGGAYSLIATGYKTALDSYSSAITAIDNFRYEQLVSPDSEYQKSLAALRKAKSEFLKQRSYVATLDVNGQEYASATLTLKASEEDYNRLLASYEALGNAANQSLTELVAALRQSEEMLRNIEDSFSDNIKAELQAKAEELEIAVNEAKNSFFADFETQHADDIDAITNALIAEKNKLMESVGDDEG